MKPRVQNCRAFYRTNSCMNGDRCNFRHEHRDFKGLARHYYTTKLYTLESLFSNSKDQEKFVNDFETDASRLPFLKAIRVECSEDEEESTASDCSSSDFQDSSLSFAEMKKMLVPCEENSSLNTSIGSSEDGSTEIGLKQEDEQKFESLMTTLKLWLSSTEFKL